MRISTRYTEALEFARKAHEGQIRKGTDLPYLTHPIAVSSLVLEYGGAEDQAIAALLHDTIEDCGVTPEELRDRFGEAVSRMVVECVAARVRHEGDWKQREANYLQHLREKVSEEALLVSACDKLHTATAIVRDVAAATNPEIVWSRFSAPKVEIAWYYLALHSAYSARLHAMAEPADGFRRLVSDLQGMVLRLADASATDRSHPYVVWLGDEMADREESWTEIRRFIHREEALQFARAYARYIVARADSGSEWHIGYRDRGPELPFFDSWKYIHSVRASGPNLDWSCESDPEALAYPSDEDMDLIERRKEEHGGTDRVRAWLKVRRLRG
jgi:hypothetical protein